MQEENILETVRQYYGRVLKNKKDLQTNVCCTAEVTSPALRAIADEIHPEVKSKFYGCGSPIPHQLEGMMVLDLGCGSGRDCYLLSKLVGPTGKVIGIDMTDEQLNVAREYLDYHTKKFNFSKPNVGFLKGYIEDLEGLGLQNESVDVVVSNCVINLSPNKERVFREIFRVLKPGGELYFSDVFSGRRVPKDFVSDPILLGECLGGVMYVEDFRRLLRTIGILDYRVISKSQLTPTHPDIQKKVGVIDFYSITLRAFKLNLEDLCEDYGQMATYLGGMQGAPNAFVLDDHHRFEKGRPVPVCGNTAAMLSETRFGTQFKIIGDRSIHYGPYECGPKTPSSPTGGCC